MFEKQTESMVCFAELRLSFPYEATDLQNIRNEKEQEEKRKKTGRFRQRREGRRRTRRRKQRKQFTQNLCLGRENKETFDSLPVLQRTEQGMLLNMYFFFLIN